VQRSVILPTPHTGPTRPTAPDRHLHP
jgi:hypothetical protein